MTIVLFIILQWLPSTSSVGDPAETYTVYRAPMNADGSCGAFLKIASVNGVQVGVPDTPAMENSCFQVTFTGSDGIESAPSEIAIPVAFDPTPNDLRVTVSNN